MLLQVSLLLALVITAAAVTSAPFVVPMTTAIPLPKECPSSAKVFSPTNACYWVIRETWTWAEAERECVRKGGKLASVEVEDENEFIYDFTRAANLSAPTFWLGMLNRNKSGHYIWHDGMTPRTSQAFFKNFIAREVGNGSRTEMCVSMWSDYTQADGSWHPWNCGYQGYSGLCKKKFRPINPMDLRSTIAPLEDSIQINRCCTHCGKTCAYNERCIPDDLDCLVKECPGAEGHGWCLPSKIKN